MKSYVLSLLIGWLIGMIYAFSGIRSPAPPVVALVGLLGILAGESTVTALKQHLAGRRSTAPAAIVQKTGDREKQSNP